MSTPAYTASIPQYFKLQDATTGNESSGLVYSYAGAGKFKMLNTNIPGQTQFTDFANFFIPTIYGGMIPGVLPSALGLYNDTDTKDDGFNPGLNYIGLANNGWDINNKLTNLTLVQAYPCDQAKCSTVFYVQNTEGNYLQPAGVQNATTNMTFGSTGYPWKLMVFGPSFILQSTANLGYANVDLTQTPPKITYTTDSKLATNFEIYKGNIIVSGSVEEKETSSGVWEYWASAIDATPAGIAGTTQITEKRNFAAIYSGPNCMVVDTYVKLNMVDYLNESTSTYLGDINSNKFTVLTTNERKWKVIQTTNPYNYYIDYLSNTTKTITSPPKPQLVRSTTTSLSYLLPSCPGNSCPPSAGPNPNPNPNPNPGPGPSSGKKGVDTTTIVIIVVVLAVVVAAAVAVGVIGAKKGWFKTNSAGSKPLVTNPAAKATPIINPIGT
jgi:hypothetical protein